MTGSPPHPRSRGRAVTRPPFCGAILLLAALTSCAGPPETEQAGPPPAPIHCDDGLWDDLDLREILDLPTEQVTINNSLPGPSVSGLCSVGYDGEWFLTLKVGLPHVADSQDFIERFGAGRTHFDDLDAFIDSYDPDDPFEPIVVVGVAHTASVEGGDSRPWVIDLEFLSYADDRDAIDDARQLIEGAIEYVESHLERQENRRT